MHYFVQTPSGETGPFTVAQLNRMHRAGEIVGSQLCREENSTEWRRLEERFRHMGSSEGSKELVEKVRASVDVYNRDAGDKEISLGIFLTFAGVVYFFFGPILPIPGGIGMFIVGITTSSRGAAQKRRGRYQSRNLPYVPPKKEDGQSPKAN